MIRQELVNYIFDTYSVEPDDDPRRVFLQLHFYADDRNVLKDVDWWRRSRRKTRSRCMVCVFPSYRSSGIQAFRRSTQKILTCIDIVSF